METMNIKKMKQDIIRYFLAYTDFDNRHIGYGLTADHSLNKERASIAASGFFLPALILAHTSEILSDREFKQKARKTVKTLLNMETFHGFYPHFVDTVTGKRYKTCEYSTIDSALLFAGLITLDSYVYDPDLHEDIMTILKRVDWELFVDEKEEYLRMAYNPDKNGDYVKGKPGFISQWDMFAEQLILYVIMAGLLDNEHLSVRLYQHFQRHTDGDLIYPPHNTLFIYHMPLCFLDLRSYTDINKVSWYDNAIKGTLSHIKTAQDLQDVYPTFKAGFYGMNASDTKKGYRVFGALPNIENHVDTDGTIAPYSILGGMPYVDSQSLVQKLLTIPNLYQEYGFKDAFTLENNDVWVSPKYISIDKGIELLSLEQLLDDTIRQLFMKHPIVQQGLHVLQFTTKE